MKVLLIIIMILTSASLANSQKVRVGADRSVDLSKYKTYAWDPARGSANPLIHQLIVDAVDQAMAAKGLRKVDKDPEMMVTFLAATQSGLHMSYPTWTPGHNSINTGIVVGTQSWPVTEGTLIVDISDAKTTNNLWRATAVHTLDQGLTGDAAKDAKGVTRVIKKAVTKMFKQYPYPRDKDE